MFPLPDDKLDKIRSVLREHNGSLCACLLKEALRQAGHGMGAEAEAVRELAGGHLSLAFSSGSLVFITDDDAIGRVMKKGGGDDAHLNMARAHLRPGGTVVDVGANIGMFTVPLAKMVGPTGRVYAFEPHPRCAAVLRKNLTLNGLDGMAEVREKALYSYVGLANLYFSPKSVDNNGDHRIWPDPNEAREHVGVTVSTLDDELGGAKVDLIKIDTQGCEQQVLLGAAATLARSPGVALSMELWALGLRHTGGSEFELIDRVEELGFTVRIENHETGELDLVDLNKVREFLKDNQLRELLCDMWCFKGPPSFDLTPKTREAALSARRVV
jgi:FkbM family methyltransferase